MIKVNLLLVKKRKKAKPIPVFFLGSIGGTLLVVFAMVYLVFFFNSRIAAKQKIVDENTKKIEELQKKNKSQYEMLNKKADKPEPPRCEEREGK